MKKIITLVLATGLLTAAYAQSPYHQDSRNDGPYSSSEYGRGLHDHPGYYPSYRDQKRFEIDKINQHYDVAIREISNNDYMSRRQKRKAIRDLQIEKENRMRQVAARYDDYYRR